MNKLVIQIILSLLFSYSYAQTNSILLDHQNVRQHALVNISDFESVLNQLSSSNNPLEKKIITSNCIETIFDKLANIEDDLSPKNPTSKFADFIPPDTYLERFSLLFKPNNLPEAVKFTNIFVSDVHTDKYTYVNACFEYIFKGSHKVTKMSYKKKFRIATIKVFQNNGKIFTKIVTLKLSNPSGLSEIQKESDDFEGKLEASMLLDRSKLEQQITDRNKIYVNDFGGGALNPKKVNEPAFINGDIEIAEESIDKQRSLYFSGGLTLPLIRKVEGSKPDLAYRILIGMTILKSLGYYAQFTSNFSTQKSDYTVTNLPDNYYYNLSSQKYFSRLGAVAGLIYNITPVFFYAGVGWGYSNHMIKADLYNYSDNQLLKSINLGDKNSYQGIETNAGIILKFHRIGLSAGISSIRFKYYEISLGTGYFF